VLFPNDFREPVSRHLLASLVSLATAGDREKAARQLAAALGCRDLLLFVVDADLGIALPAPGFPQTLPNGTCWAEFLRGCVTGRICRSQQIFPGSSEPREVVATTGRDGTVLVLSGGEPNAEALAVVVELLPLVSAAFQGEQMAGAAQAQTVAAEAAARNARSLAQALDHMRQDLEHALNEAEHALEARDEFLSVAAHELKTPLTGLMLQVQMIQRTVRRLSEPTPAGEQLLGLVASMDRSLRRLATLTNDLLDVSRMTEGRLDIRREPGDLTDVVREALARFADDARNRGVELLLHANGTIPGEWDLSRLDQVVTNLVANALTHGEGRCVEVHLVPAPEHVRIEVQDNGSGVAPEDRERIFQRFERASSNGDGSGLGLGLHITREIVEAHGGRIFVDDRPGPGATFVVDLPYGG
jgi:signal transduction histidine kinase